MQINKSAREIYQKAIVIDMLEALFPVRDMSYFETVRDAGVTAVHATVAGVHDEFPAAVTRVAEFHKAVEAVKNVEIVCSVDDILKAKREGHVAIIAGIQSPMPFERNLDLITIFHKLGIRIIQLAYHRQSLLGAGCVESVDHGLTDQGRDAVKELNRLGILVDVSHCGNQTAIEAAKCSEVPIAITHSTPKALVGIRRSKSDDAIKAVAERGGVIGQVIESPFCQKTVGVRKERPDIGDFIDCLEYIVKLVGVDHAGLAFDLTPFWTESEWYGPEHSFGPDLVYPNVEPSYEERYVEGFDSVSDTIKVAEELLNRGYSGNDIEKILGVNWVRLLKEVWRM